MSSSALRKATARAIEVAQERKESTKKHKDSKARSIAEKFAGQILVLNEQEIVTMMTICDYPKYLAIGYLLNQNMLKKNDKITNIKKLVFVFLLFPLFPLLYLSGFHRVDVYGLNQ